MELIVFLICVGVIALIGLTWTLIDMKHENNNLAHADM